MKKFLQSNWALLCILVLAFGFRFWQIGHLPAGLFPDEAANGLDINSIFQGDIQPFYERGNGREALFFYFEAFSALLFGRGVWQAHIVSAAFGFIAVIAAYFLAKRLFSKRIALLATFFMAISGYAVTVTRTAFRANTVPLLATLTLFFVVKFFQEDDKKAKYWTAAWAGLFFALGFYTYTSFRMMVPLVIGFELLLFVSQRSNWKRIVSEYWKYKKIFLTTFTLGIAWLAIYFIQHPKSFVGRAGQVSIFNPELNNGDIVGTLIDVFCKTMFSFFTRGDINWRHNIAGFPFLNPLISPFFLLALLIFTFSIFLLLKQVWQKKVETKTVYQALMACWFWFMLVPEITTAEGIPHGLRLIGVIPVIFIMAAWGINWLWEKMPHNDHLKPEKYVVIGFFVFVMTLYHFALYFGIAAGSAQYYRAFRGDLTVVSEYINKRNQKDKTYLSLDTFWLQTVDYLTTEKNRPFQALDPAHTYEVKLNPKDQVIFTQSTLFDRQQFLKSYPESKLVVQQFNQFGEIIMLVYEK